VGDWHSPSGNSCPLRPNKRKELLSSLRINFYPMIDLVRPCTVIPTHTIGNGAVPSLEYPYLSLYLIFFNIASGPHIHGSHHAAPPTIASLYTAPSAPAQTHQQTHPFVHSLSLTGLNIDLSPTRLHTTTTPHNHFPPTPTTPKSHPATTPQP
jgi:hypothetical protein